jgi:hypothetical protein
LSYYKAAIHFAANDKPAVMASLDLDAASEIIEHYTSSTMTAIFVVSDVLPTHILSFQLPEVAALHPQHLFVVQALLVITAFGPCFSAQCKDDFSQNFPVRNAFVIIYK